MMRSVWLSLAVSGVMLGGATGRGLGQAAGAVPAPPAGSAGISTMLAPALASVRQATAGVDAQKWKAPKPVKDSTAANLVSIRKDLDETLPGLMAAADKGPGSAAGTLPVLTNIGALYDVLLRVMVVADAAATDQQTAALTQALAALDGAKRGIAAKAQSAAEAEDQQVAGLQKQLSARTATAAAPAAPAPCTPVPAKKKKGTSGSAGI